MAQTLSKSKGSLVLILFGIPFFCIGIGAQFLAYMELSPYLERKDWRQVEAVLTKLEFEPIGKSLDKLLEIEYQYKAGNQFFTNDELQYSKPDPFQQKEIYDKLVKNLENETPITVFYNPDKPEQSCLLNPFLNTGLLLSCGGGIFLLFSSVIIALGFSQFKIAKIEEKLKSDFPDSPWRWDNRWANGTVVGDRKGNLKVFAVFILFWFLFSTIVYAAVLDDLEGAGFIIYIAWGMYSLGLLFIFFWIRSYLRYSKYGKCRLEIETFPGKTGETFEATIKAPYHLQPTSDFYFRMQCTRTITTGHGDSRRSKTETVWEDGYAMDPKETISKGEFIDVPVSFPIPKSLPKVQDGISWKIYAWAETEGLDWSEGFVVPIYK